MVGDTALNIGRCMVNAIGICMDARMRTSLQRPLHRKRRRAAKATAIKMRIEFVESVQVVQSQEANTEYINKALSTAVNALLSDKELIACLAGQGK